MECCKKVVKEYGKGELEDISDPDNLHEAKLLMLDITKAKFELGWEPGMNIDQCIALTVEWYKRYRGGAVYDLCCSQIEKYIND